MATDLQPPVSRRGDPVWELAEYTWPRQGEWTDAEYLKLDRSRVELVDGCLEFLPMGEDIHQEAHDFLVSLLRGILGRGYVYSSGYRLKVPGGFREPDVIATRDRSTFTRSFADAADFVAEVISPGQSNRERDEVTKPVVYAAAGVSEYWIIDPQPRTIRQLVLDGDTYRDAGTFGLGDAITSTAIEGFVVRVGELFGSTARSESEARDGD